MGQNLRPTDHSLGPTAQPSVMAHSLQPMAHCPHSASYSLQPCRRVRIWWSVLSGRCLVPVRVCLCRSSPCWPVPVQPLLACAGLLHVGLCRSSPCWPVPVRSVLACASSVRVGLGRAGPCWLVPVRSVFNRAAVGPCRSSPCSIWPRVGLCRSGSCSIWPRVGPCRSVLARAGPC